MYQVQYPCITIKKAHRASSYPHSDRNHRRQKTYLGTVLNTVELQYDGTYELMIQYHKGEYDTAGPGVDDPEHDESTPAETKISTVECYNRSSFMYHPQIVRAVHV
jgi:hypothetical protein